MHSQDREQVFLMSRSDGAGLVCLDHSVSMPILVGACQVGARGDPSTTHQSPMCPSMADSQPTENLPNDFLYRRLFSGSPSAFS
jgi:hypothetical protein